MKERTIFSYQFYRASCTISILKDVNSVSQWSLHEGLQYKNQTKSSVSQGYGLCNSFSLYLYYFKKKVTHTLKCFVNKAGKKRTNKTKVMKFGQIIAHLNWAPWNVPSGPFIRTPFRPIIRILEGLSRLMDASFSL